MGSVNATRADLARLFGRAAFGATGADFLAWEGKPYADAVDSLFPPAPVTEREPSPDDATRLALSQSPSQYNDIAAAGRWWLERMRTTAWPLEERLTLFWHDHFATGFGPQPDMAMMLVQNQTLRTHALGDFRALANAMTVDTAMLYWLNGIASRVGFANENYAREFLELFTLGTVPQVYTETDIREAARVFTGWLVNAQTRAATFTPARHDHGIKTVLGRLIGGYGLNDPREAVEYQEVTDAALAHDGGVTASRFLAYKLVQNFGYQPDEQNLDGDALVVKVAAAFREGWDIAHAVRTMLMADEWRYADPTAGRQLVRSPIELVVHAAKILGVECDLPGGQLSSAVPYNAANRMGQVPFRPPNVGGWPTGADWLSHTTNLARYDAMFQMWQAYVNQQQRNVTGLPPSNDTAHWAWFMGLPDLTPSTLARLHDYLALPGTTVETDRQASMFVLVGVSPDWQVM